MAPQLTRRHHRCAVLTVFESLLQGRQVGWHLFLGLGADEEGYEELADAVALEVDVDGPGMAALHPVVALDDASGANPRNRLTAVEGRSRIGSRPRRRPETPVRSPSRSGVTGAPA